MSQQLNLQQEVLYLFEKMDWVLLRKQKQALLLSTDESHREEFDGLIHLVDKIQDLAVDSGLVDDYTVFGT